MSEFTEARRIFCLKHRKRYAKLLKEGYSYAAAARKVGVRIDIASVWRNGKHRNGLKSKNPYPPFYNEIMYRPVKIGYLVKR